MFPLRLSLNFKTFADKFSGSAPHRIGYPFLYAALYSIWTALKASISSLWFSVYIVSLLEGRDHALFVFVSSVPSDVWHPGGV